MFKILVVSDSHGRMEHLEKVIKNVDNVNMLIHCGDIQGDEERLRSLCYYPVRVVRGNSDYSSKNQNFIVVEVLGHKIFVTHGHLYEVYWGLERLTYAALEQGCDIALYGHTHVPEVIYGDDVTIANPGSISRPRQYNYKPSYMIMEIDDEGEVNYLINYIEK